MYTRSYGGERSAIPENYDGIAFGAPEPAEHPECREETLTSCSTADCSVGRCQKSTQGIRLPFFGDLFGGGIGGIFSSIGTEELLIIGIALFLIFSGDGDTECALMLLFLLFIR